MNDITALMATMKAAAEKAIGAHERLNAMPSDGLFDASLAENTQLESDITALIAHNDASTPANVRALVEALEKAQRYIDRLREWNANLAYESCEYQKRIAELESRTVTVKLPAEYLNADGSVNADMANTCPVVSAYREAHRAAGIQVIEGEGQ